MDKERESSISLNRYDYSALSGLIITVLDINVYHNEKAYYALLHEIGDYYRAGARWFIDEGYAQEIMDDNYGVIDIEVASALEQGYNLLYLSDEKFPIDWDFLDYCKGVVNYDNKDKDVPMGRLEMIKGVKQCIRKMLCALLEEWAYDKKNNITKPRRAISDYVITDPAIIKAQQEFIEDMIKRREQHERDKIKLQEFENKIKQGIIPINSSNL